MNPSNPFGSPQGGAFQAPSNTMKAGLFPSFGQQSSSNQPQPMGFFQPTAFGQPSALNQPPSQGNAIFGQTPAFGQTSTQPPSQPTISQALAFGQQALGMSSSGFGSGTAPAFGQTAAQNQSSPFGQTAAQNQSSPFGQTVTQTQSSPFGQTVTQTQSSPFGQTATQTQSSAFGQTAAQNPNSVFGQTSSFGQASAFGQAPGFSQQPSSFGNSLSGSTTTIGQPQPPGFGQSVFGQPSSTSVSTSGFGTTPSVTQSRGFGSSKSTFKPANEALFKPIFSASPEPANPQTTAMTSSPFGSTVSQTTSSSMGSSTPASVFSTTTGAQPGPPGFSFSQPAAAPSITTQNNPLTTDTSNAPSNPLKFTFSQPAAPSSSSTQASTTEPTTPSTFSFSATSLLPQAAPLFGGTNFGQPPAYSDTRAEAEEKGSNLGETNVFARLGKGTKRKEDLTAPSTGPDKPATGEEEGEEEEEDVHGRDSPRQPSKRPLMRSRGPPVGLFGRALNCLRKDTTHPVMREATKETESIQALAERAATPPSAVQAPETAEKSDSPKAPDSASGGVTTPVRRGSRRDSMESLGGMSPTDCTVLQCRNVPPALNKKEVMEKHFGRFGKVRKVYCRPGKNLAIVHFDDHAAAAKAKKKGKLLHRHELLLLWQRKKQSPGDKGSRASAERGEAEGGSQEDMESKDVSSSLRKGAHRGPALSSLMSFSRSSPVKKSSLAKALQFDTEPQKESSSEAPGSERPVPSSLLHLMGQLAPTAEDKFRLLEQRDKILRQGRPRRTDLVLSKVFVGTCPDMCPEKERYMRETRKQLSVFEVFPETEMVDHSAAIKEYSRSSADQEEPLPHELRPLPVLSMTMDYLVSLIMDQGHDNYRDWYDFLWNRTRGIRKDIIQQHLCCPHTVSLIEKCTRFHVHCAHHLCEEHMSTFDAKINNENMTKCLQSLKEMYQDLNTRNIYCPLEAEFRLYSVLVKLNDGDILREVQQFRDEVRNSPEVKFAVQVFTAVNSNNFVRFFKLVKGASYLASCLLHRYFNQVRAMALKIMNTAHTVGPRSTAFPVEDLVRMLMFRTTDEGTDFIQQYGLNVNEGMVELSRIAFQEPELPLSQKKSAGILAKRSVLIGEVVNGGSLPNPPQHTPACSFDPQNKYRGEGPLAEPTQSLFKAIAAKVEAKAPPSVEFVAQVVPDVAAMFGLPPAGPPEVVPLYHSPAPAADAQMFQPIAQPPPVKPPSPPPKPQPVYSNEEIVAELDSVVEEVVGAAVMEVAEAGASYATTALVESGVQVESLLGEVLGQMLQDVSSTEIRLEQQRVTEEKRKLDEARRKQEHEAFLVDFSFSLCSELIYEVLDETIKETATSEIKEAVNEKADRVAKCTEQVCTSLVEDTLDADIARLVEAILEDELQCIHKYIKRWRDVVAVRRQLKRQMRGFPAAPCCVDPRFKLKALAPSAPAQPSMADLARGVVNLGNSGTLALSSTRLLKMREEAIHQMRVHFYYQQLLDQSVWAPLDLPALVTENIPNPPERIFWKAVLLLPSDHDNETSLADRILSDWLEVKLGGGKDSEGRDEQLDGALQTLCVTNTLQDRGEHTHKVHISIKASRGPLSEDGLSKAEGLSELQGTAALMVLLPAMPLTEQEEQDIPLLSALLQLKQLQQAKGSWHCPLPLAVLVPEPAGGPGDTQEIEEALMLHTLVQEGLISEFTFFFILETTSELQGTKQLSQATRWLLARAPPLLPLSCQTLVQLVEDALSREFSPRVYAHHQDRAAALLPSQEPAPVIQLYNAVLAHLADKVSSPDLSRLSWPPGEFCLQESQDFVPHLGWNSPKHLAWLREAILTLQLPKWEQISATDSWPELCASIFHFSAQIPVSHRSQPLLMSRLENLLERVRVKGHRTQTSRSNRGDEDVGPTFSQIPWDDILVICIDHKLKDWQIPEPPVCEDAVTDDGEILVYLPIETLKGFRPPGEWTEVIRQTHREKQQEEEGAGAAASAPPSSLSIRQRLFDSLAPETTAAPMDITHTPTAGELLAHNVLQSLEREKAASQRSMKQLQRWLDGDNLDHLSTPLFIPSSTLLSMPPNITRVDSAKTPDYPLTQPSEPDDLSDKVDSPKTTRVSMSWRIKELERQILASHGEELAWKLKLSGLLSIVDD
ncbi:germinal-center associated nuclear protein isoform X1 [Gymnodraco acuticeps]|uniref:Germinal-center associated nuclear protein n=1 Tax=Gymnodraco acuticeps TaxID=8218 RepID=A0A6P8UJZ8_GYMAC|nr:germinal-center associated nuclear protein isoform X1 [Gymnodraco acuticeps]